MGWESHYRELVKKVERMEQDFVDERLIRRIIGGETYYFVPKTSFP